MRIPRAGRHAAAAAFLAAFAFVGCSRTAPDGGQRAGDLAVDTAFQKKLQEQLLDAKPGTVVEIPAGSWHLDRGLSLRASGVTLRGAGLDKTILSFRGQVAGPEGLLVQASDFTIEGLTIEDSQGDGLKVNDGENITIRAVRIRWTDGPKTSNGAYGIYPVKTRNVLIEDSQSFGASDAGIYVGQSKNVIVRRCRAEQNVAGIEIENTIDADVYENVATGNTGGILVFNMPNLSQPGHSTRVYKNRVEQNNLGNFGAKGTAVASVPAGSGVVVNSNTKVEIFDNDVLDNRTANVIISSYFSTGYYSDKGVEPGYDPYPKAIYVHGNRFSGGGDSPDGVDLKVLKTAMFGLSGRFPDVLWDGYADPKATGAAEARLCVNNGQAGVLNADGPGKYKNPRMVTDELRCDLPRLSQVNL
ncbi:parallel beta-helix domain-containing protein [Ideonella sp.]|uniref:parallel beta-helix domain-containing protein n=1 Tax=Ideonella sp. TaxID=1929293 RepID=UPI002B469002|nr:parallel beta-helix domain-containing protein [Ideonella sp.]HJV67997.1 parallel beta-helix domain-containing protein [Ideonella sp.]